MKLTLLPLLYLTLSFTAPLQGQLYTYHSDAPFGIETVLPDTTRTAQAIFFQDFDNDGDLDLFLTGLDYFDNVPSLTWDNLHFFIVMQENTGDAKNPQFGPRQDIFQQFPYPRGYFFAAGGDLDNDADMDLMTVAEIDYIGNEKVRMLTNTGLQGADQFQITNMDVFGLTDYVAESLFIPVLTDLDNDGDLDLMTSGVNSAFGEEDGPNVPKFYYARNAGTANTPIYEGWYNNPYGLIPDTSGEILTAGDINNDGNIDFLGSLLTVPNDSISPLLVHLNTPGVNGKPAFTTPLVAPYGLPVETGENQLLFPSLVDIDDDGDLDLFVFRLTGDGSVLQYYNNNLCQPTSQDISETICEGQTLVYEGVVYSVAGDYTITLENSQHCDSIINLTLNVLPASFVEIEATICHGDIYQVGNESFADPGNYVVVFVGSNGCDSIVNLVLTVDPIPTVSIETTICDGDSYTIGNETFSNPGNYMIHLTGGNGCDSIILLTLLVDIVDPSVFVNENILMAAQSGATYQWFDCDAGQNIPGATNQTYEVLVTGNYQVYITDALGCTVQSMCLPVIISAVDQLSKYAIRLFPNPASDILYVANESAFPIGTCLLWDLTGNVVARYVHDGKTGFNVSGLSPGVYMWTTRVNGQTVMKKVVILE